MNKTLTYFVTGASGFVGQNVCLKLKNSGHNVRTIIRRSDDLLEGYGVEIWQGDLFNEKLLCEAINGIDIIIHCAGNARYGNGPQYQRENVELTSYLISMLEQHANDTRFIYVSTIGAIDRSLTDRCSFPLDEKSLPFPSSDYGKSKLRAEELIRKSSLIFSIIRPTMVVGVNMRSDSHFAVFARKALTGSLLSRINWPGKFSVIDVQDLANAIFIVSSDERAIGETYFCGGESISVGEFMKICNPSIYSLPMGLISKIASFFPIFLPFRLKAMLLNALTASDEKLRKLNWQPKFNVRASLDKIIHREKFRLDPSLSPGGQTVITGAASGLGRALAIKLSPNRDRLLLVDKDRLALEKLALQLNNAIISVVDLANILEIETFIKSANWQNTDITELYACAGIGLRGKIQDISISNHYKLFNLNVLSRIYLGRAAINKMKSKNFGRLILISSSSAFQALPFMATYAGSNSALLSIGEAWSFETDDEGIHVMTVCPGGMHTNFQKSGGVKENIGENLMMPEDVAEQIISGLKKRKITLIISNRSLAMSILARIIPRQWSIKLWGYLMEKIR